MPSYLSPKVRLLRCRQLIPAPTETCDWSSVTNNDRHLTLFIGRLDIGGAPPGIDLVDRLEHRCYVISSPSDFLTVGCINCCGESIRAPIIRAPGGFLAVDRYPFRSVRTQFRHNSPFGKVTRREFLYSFPPFQQPTGTKGGHRTDGAETEHATASPRVSFLCLRAALRRPEGLISSCVRGASREPIVEAEERRRGLNSGLRLRRSESQQHFFGENPL
jgi:hypothetical protein